MSETETRKGVVTLVSNSLKEFMISKGYNVEIDEDELLDRYYMEEFESSYVYANDKVYKIKQDHDIKYTNIYQATELPNGDIKFLVQYHNGGTSFDEAIGIAINNMKK